MKSNFDTAMEKYRLDRAHEIELNRATSAFESSLIQPLLLLNGGAIVTFLALLGAIWDRSDSVIIPLVVLAVGCWVLGLLLAALTIFGGYISQRAFTQAIHRRRRMFENAQGLFEPQDDDQANYTESAVQERMRAGRRWRTTAIWTGVASLLSFVIGAMPAIWMMIAVDWRMGHG